jgi:hypothetical protein
MLFHSYPFLSFRVPAGDVAAVIQGLAKPIAEFIRGERGPIATAEEGRISLRMVLASYVSKVTVKVDVSGWMIQ